MCDVGTGSDVVLIRVSGFRVFCWETEGFVRDLYYVVFCVLINELELHNPGFICPTN